MPSFLAIFLSSPAGFMRDHFKSRDVCSSFCVVCTYLCSISAAKHDRIGVLFKKGRQKSKYTFLLLAPYLREVRLLVNVCRSPNERGEGSASNYTEIMAMARNHGNGSSPPLPSYHTQPHSPHHPPLFHHILPDRIQFCEKKEERKKLTKLKPQLRMPLSIH